MPHDANTTSTAPISDYDRNLIKGEYQYNQFQLNNILFPVNTHINLSLGQGNRKTKTEEQQQTQLGLYLNKIFNLNDKKYFQFGIIKVALQGTTTSCSIMQCKI